jgi:hypothetical protein
MNTPHERLSRTTFSLPLGEVHALAGGAVNARPPLFLHSFPDDPPTAVPFLEVMPNLGHVLQVEAPTTIAARVARWSVALRARGARGRARTCLTSRDEHCSPFRGEL